MEGSDKTTGLRERLRIIVFGVDTPAGKFFDVILLSAILISVLGVILESVEEIRSEYGNIILGVEWFFTVLFTLEYLTRLWISLRPLRYARSFFGMVDLLSILPTYIAIFAVSGAPSLIVIRAFRLLRVFRILKLSRYVSGADQLVAACKASRHKIIVFLFFVLAITVIMGTLMYLIERDLEQGFTSIPKGIYWAIVTLTTVGYGDISPQTPLGQALASFLMIVGYAVIAVPTGIVSAEIAKQGALIAIVAKRCTECDAPAAGEEAKFCHHCGVEHRE